VAASDHLNKDQMVKMYHISWDDTPPHELEPTSVHRYKEGENIHPDVMHMGTRRAALTIHRTHLHEYEADPSEIDPVVYGDEQWLLDVEKDFPENYRARDIKASMQGVQQGLWETVTGDPRDAVTKGRVIPYRNLSEDVGSISYLVPKAAIQSGKVKYVGVTNLAKDNHRLRKKLEQEENL
jgi:hypothetical protein